MVIIKIGNRNLLSYFGIGPKYDRMWSNDEDLCRKHNTAREYVGYSEWASQNMYLCHTCELENPPKHINLVGQPQLISISGLLKTRYEEILSKINKLSPIGEEDVTKD